MLASPGQNGDAVSDAKVEDEDEEREAAPVVNMTASSKKKKKCKASAGASMFALLQEEDGAADDDDAGDEDEDDEEAEPNTTSNNSTPSLVVAEILSVKNHPKADRLIVCQVDSGATSPLTIVTNAKEAKAGMFVVVALPGTTTPGSGVNIEKAAVRGVESEGMLCSAYDLGWESSPDGTLVQLLAGDGELDVGDECPEKAPDGAVWGKADEEEVEEMEEKKDKKKKKKKEVDMASGFAALSLLEEGSGGNVEEEEDEAAAKENTKKKKKKEVDIDALLAEAAAVGGGGDTTMIAVEAEEAGKKDKKKKKAKEDPDLDALLAEIDGPPAAAAAQQTEAGSKKDKKKKKKKKSGDKEEGGRDEDEDLDAILAELGMAPKEEGEEAQAAVEAAKPAEKEKVGDAGEGSGKELSAAAKRKLKKKAKKAAEGEGGEAGEEETAAAAAKGVKKVSAAVKRMQEALEAQRKAEEEARLAAEEAARVEAEEEAVRIAEEERKKEEAARRKADKEARREQLKKEGKLLTGKAKAEAERLAKAREQLLKQAGLDPEALAPKKKPVYNNKKKKGPATAATATKKGDITESEEFGATTEAAAAAVAADEDLLAKEEKKGEEAVVDSWEEAADDWEAIDAEEITVPVVSKEEEDEEEEKEVVKAAAPAAAKKAPAAAAGKKKIAPPKGRVTTAKPAPPSSSEEDEDSDEDSSSEEGSSSEDNGETSSSEDESSSEYTSSDEDSDNESDDGMEERIYAARKKREARWNAAVQNRDPNQLRSPICCILGHVDTGKTKILDNIRRTNVQDGEAGGITQQIGATYIPEDALTKRTEELRAGRAFDLRLPGLLVIDTPGHESFSNLRSRGSGLCDIAVLVVDLMHGLEQQTIESINLLKMRKTPFIIAMNKVDRIYGWNSVPNSPIMKALERQDQHAKVEFEQRLNEVSVQLMEQGLNVALYWKNKDPRTFVNIVPTSAITGEGIPDLLQLVVKLTQSLMAERLAFVDEPQCTVLEVKQVEGLGTTIDAVLVNGALREGDSVVVCGLNGPIQTTIRALLTPQPMKEIRVKGTYVHHKEIRAAMGIKIAAHNLENAVAGTQLLLVRPDDDIEAVKAEVMQDMAEIFSSVDRTGEGVAVQASTLGSLEALLEFLRSPGVEIPVSAINIGPVHKKDVMRANVMIERKMKKYGVILAFDVPVSAEAKSMAEELGVKVFTADIIYHLFDQFTAYLKRAKEEEQEAAKLDAVFPCVLKIMPTCIFNKKDPIVLGVEVVEGIAKVGTPICVPTQGGIDLGRIASMEKEHKVVDTAKRGDSIAMKIDATKPEEAARLYGRHFDHKDELVSRISRKSIDVLKSMFRDDLSRDDWKLVVKLKKTFNID
jgi:translation initiation factor 5B